MNAESHAIKDEALIESGQVVYVDHLLWRQLGEARTPEHFSHAWLALQCSMVADVSIGLVVLGAPDTGPYKPAGVWPENEKPTPELANAAEKALAERHAQLVQTTAADVQGQTCIAYPLLVDGLLHGVVALQVNVYGDAGIKPIMRQLQWGASWLEIFLRRQQDNEESGINERLMSLVDFLAVSIRHKSFADATLALVTEMSAQLECERVSVGFVRKQQIKLEALSYSAKHGEEMNLVRLIEAAMDECVDQHEFIRFPDNKRAVLVTREHATLAEEYKAGDIMTLPLSYEGEDCGALMLERPADRPFTPDEAELLKGVAAIMGPVLETIRRNDRWLLQKIRDAGVEQLGRIIGPGYLGRKLLAGALVIFMSFMSFATGEFRVSADSVLEGKVRRVISSPIEGYLSEAGAQAGDIVRSGDLLFALDDSELKLERLRIMSERAKLQRQAQEAAAKRERAQVNVINAQIDQASAQLELVDAQLARTRMVAPFDGIVVNGDLSQSIGTSVQRGQVMFEIAPLNDYRVKLRVDEQLISYLEVGQQGTLILSALPGEPIPLTVEKIVPVAKAEEGRNYFRVEATPERVEGMRPGMEGVAKIEVGTRSLIWIWSRETVTWLRLWLWSWWP